MAQGLKNHQQYRGHRRPGFHSWVWKIPGGGNDHPLQWPRESHGQKILVGYSPKGHKEVETTECKVHEQEHDVQASLQAGGEAEAGLGGGAPGGSRPRLCSAAPASFLP